MKNWTKVVKYLMKQYNIPADRVIRHYDVCGKLCPEPWVRVPSEWQEFKRLITEPKIKEDMEMVEPIKITVNGKGIKADTIVKDGRTFSNLRSLENAGFKVGYDNATKMRVLDNKVDELPVEVNGEKTSVEAVNIKGYNYIPVRSICKAMGKEVSFDKGTVIIE